MGWCGEFGRYIERGCDHAMVAGSNACTCEHCGTSCGGKFTGCKAVWAAGPVKRGPAPKTAIPLPFPTPMPSPTGVTSPAGAGPPKNGHPAETLDGRLLHLDTTMGRISDDLVALRRNVAGTNSGGPDDDRLSRLEHGLDQMALDMAEALRLMRPVPQTLQAQQGQFGVLSQRLTDLGHELSALQKFVTMQQATIDRLAAGRAAGISEPRPRPLLRRPDGPGSPGGPAPASGS